MLLSVSQIQQAIGGDRIAVSNPFFKLLRNGVQHTEVIKQLAHSEVHAPVIRVLKLLEHADIESTSFLATEIRDQHPKMSELLFAWCAHQAVLMTLEMGRPQLSRSKCAELYLEFPVIYRGRGKTGAISGFEIDFGWFDILHEASTYLESMANDQIAGRVPIQVTKVFTHGGQIRICTNQLDFNGAAFCVIEHATDRSDVTCDLCGSPGTKVGALSVIRTRCNKHKGLK